ncbi:FadR/GntR family transcriptional regulator [Corticibacterium sp. UT-5YL-CI-8]|nr:FadR/GntR family transcriptional regulator [Tianweitania sp. UT-5YL-CI-8]
MSIEFKRGSLSEQIVSEMTKRIHSGLYERGAKLPTEQVLIEEFGVSRTVVREAIANLKAGGMVTTRQGVGVFVQHQTPLRPFWIEEARLGMVNEVVSVLELRIALEVETAAIAAERHLPEHLQRMRASLATMSAAIEAGEDSIQADLSFHRTIAQATLNPHFLGLFNYLGELLIPRANLKTFALTGSSRQDYLDRINREHAKVFSAIEQNDPDGARAAMRLHLSGSKDRLKTHTAN